MVYIADNFITNLEVIRIYLSENDAQSTYPKLCKLIDSAISNLELFPEIGAHFLQRKKCSSILEAKINIVKNQYHEFSVREYVFDDYIILYSIKNVTDVYLLAIKHQKQLSYDFKDIWE